MTFSFHYRVCCELVLFVYFPYNIETKISDQKRSDRVSLLGGDAHKLPFRDGAFEYVTVGVGVRNFQNLPVAIDEMRRVLTAKGRLVVLEIVKPDGWVMSKLFPVFFGIVPPILGGIFARNKNAYLYLPKSVQDFMGISELSATLESNGFPKIRAYRFGCGSVAVIVAEK